MKSNKGKSCNHPMFKVIKGCPCDNVECKDCFYTNGVNYKKK